MPGLHPFDFRHLAPNELPPELQADGARSIGRLVAHIEQQGLRASVEQSLEIPAALWRSDPGNPPLSVLADPVLQHPVPADSVLAVVLYRNGVPVGCVAHRRIRSDEHTSELQSLMRISYSVFCLKTKKTNNTLSTLQ